MNRKSDINTPDIERRGRIGLDEAIFCEFKTSEQIQKILEKANSEGRTQFLTRLGKKKFARLDPAVKSIMDYDSESRTGILGKVVRQSEYSNVATVTAGTSDIAVAREVSRTLAYHGLSCDEYFDVGVAGLWRVLNIRQKLAEKQVVIVVAGMDAALPSVVAGLISSVVIAVPTSVGYGVADEGKTALNAILASCAPGLVTVNIDNGYGAACAAIRILNQAEDN